MKTCHLLTLLSVLVGMGSASVAQTEADGPFWIRQPQISPDGQTIAFTYRGQIWIVPSAGGEAVPLTERQFRSTSPVWSPDGRLIAFGSDRYSISDVFVMPVEGGPITRLTHNSQLERPLGFSADGSEVLFAAARLGDPDADYYRGIGGPIGMIHSVPVTGGRERLVTPIPTRHADVSPDGGTIAYVRINSVEEEWRKREKSDGTSDVWLYDIETETHRRLTDYRGRDRSPAFSADGSEIYWTTEMPEAEAGPDAAPATFNVWRMPADGGGTPTRMTAHDTLPVRFVSAADDGTLVYTYDTELWRLDPGSTEPVKVPVRMRQGTLYTGEVSTDLTGQVSEMAVSPDGSEIALVARGDIFVLSPDTGESRRITATPQTERSVSFAPDGRALLYSAERAGDWDIYVTELVRDGDTSFLDAVQLAERVLIDTDTDALQPAFSPDGERVAYRDDRNALRIWDAATGESREVLPDSATYFYGEGDFEFEWSADGRYIVTTTGFAIGNTEIELIDTTGDGERHRISDSGFGDKAPGFSPDGSVVFWATDRFSQRDLNEQGGLRDMMAAYLTPEGFVQRELGRPALPAETSNDPTADADGSDDAAAEADPPEIIPDFDGLPYRKARLTGAPAFPLLAEMTPDNAQMILATLQPPASLVGTVIDMATGQPRQFFARSFADVQALAASPDRGTLFILTHGTLEKHDVASGQSAAVPFQIEAPVDFDAEMRYIFDHQWRLVQSKFYDADMHGVDWPAMRDAYAKYLPHITHWEDFAELMSELQGELNASHMYVRFASDNPAWDQTAELGIYYDTEHEGPGVLIQELIPGGPAALVGPPLQPGAVILAVDGVEISADQDIYPLLDRKAGRVLRLTVQPPGDGPPADEFVRAAPPGTEYELAYERWVERRRAMVDELSGGRLGYTHVRGMNDPSFRQVYSDLMGPARDKEGAIIDTRFNLGGLLHDQLTAFLTGVRHSGMVTRNGVDLGTSPFTRWAKPTALLVNSWNYSDASVFPHYYIREQIGPSVGDRVPGTGTAVLFLPQQEPRLSIAFAQLGFRTTEGDFFENREIVPDEVVRAEPDLLEEGRDPQLEAAVVALIQAIDN